MAQGKKYSYSPRIFGKAGDEFLAMPRDSGMDGSHYASPEEDIPVLDYGYNQGQSPEVAGLQVPDVSTPAGIAQRDAAAVAAYLKTAPEQIRPERFVPQIPRPQVLPPPAMYNRGQDVNDLLRAYPWLSLFGGARGANAVITGAAEGIDIRGQREDQNAAQQRAYQQQALDAQYQRDLKNQELQAESNRYYNTATDQSNRSEEAYWKAGLGGLQGQAKLSSTDLARLRRESTKRIGDLRQELTSPWTSFPRAVQLMQSIEREKQSLRDELGGPETGSEIQNMTEMEKNFFNKAKALASSQTYGMEHLNRWGEIQKELLGTRETGATTRQKTMIDYYNQRDAVDEARRVSDKSLEEYRIDSNNWAKQLGAKVNYDEAENKVIQFNIKSKQEGRVAAYNAAKGDLDSLLTQQSKAQAIIERYEKIDQSGGRSYDYSPQAQDQIRDAIATLQAIQPSIDRARRILKITRGTLLLPPQTAPIRKNPLGGVGAPPVAPSKLRSGNGRHDSGGTEIIPTGPRPKPKATPAETKKQKMDSVNALPGGNG
jgi:hypothetical protein